ncbi:MAG: DMT family transporter [Bacteroidales bacterium]|nr:DMT family transporter [Bacteroidales bacterium]
MANVYIFSKAAMAELDVIQFGFYWFGMALLWSLIYMIPAGKLKSARQLNQRSRILLVIIGISELVAASTLFMAIETVENPAVVSFLANLTPIFVTIFGISILKERFNLIEGIGILLTITGALLISYTGQHKLSEIFIEGTGLITISSFFLSLSIILAKSRITHLNASILMINRISYLFFFSVLLVISTGKSLEISGLTLFNVAAGSILGPFMTALAQYSSLKYIEASRAMIIQATRGLFVVIGAIIYLNILPLPMQIIGGTITIIGVIIITLGKRMVNNRK